MTDHPPQPQTSLLGRQDIRCVLMDPPWDRERGGGQIQRGADRHYPLMSVPDIHRTIVEGCEHWDRLCDDAHIWIWVTNPVLMSGEAHELAGLLGVEPKSCFTWVKMTDEGTLQKGLGQYSMGSTEHLLLCRRGDFIRPETRHPTAFFAPRTKHSKKPEESYEIIESTSPGGYLEIFARRPRQGWIVWGNEVVG